ncbi:MULTISPECIES: hypothetical protein [unclassified Streptomyces]|uniref:hypothetical protein n=1 Tax=unclassified Streptomyces TaxID=2593676 RepID=UPI002252189B|nr:MULTISPECIES: hypothetical protein [unclassified Streptomyces]MCX5048073.1 hypothetical protein [Streptomyces sp. NBC_00474]MCX5057198.1 hypothetical protein [Streptomyces sp. NBC_00452]MCX5245923.1 hypothetical protein [Streptomyces sp. NBC_00201]MCX5288273.1 hypothetical protein [Streptomyces sp. NBC_00183]
MGALRRIWRRPRGRRVAAATVLVMTAVGGAVACDPGGLNSAAVAYTTDQTATKELERQKVDVQWLSCTANYGNNKASTGKAAPSASETTVADVDCQGQTKDGREITVTGKVTRAVNGACVRGDLTAKVGGKQWFHVSGLGNCNATPSPIFNNPSRGQQPGATVTVTVTKTIWCKGDPQCWPVEGK